MTKEEYESHVVGPIVANIYSHKKGTKLFGNKADKAVLRELTEIDNFKMYQPVH